MMKRSVCRQTCATDRVAAGHGTFGFVQSKVEDMVTNVSRCGLSRRTWRAKATMMRGDAPMADLSSAHRDEPST